MIERDNGLKYALYMKLLQVVGGAGPGEVNVLPFRYNADIMTD